MLGAADIFIYAIISIIVIFFIWGSIGLWYDEYRSNKYLKSIKPTKEELEMKALWDKWEKETDLEAYRQYQWMLYTTLGTYEDRRKFINNIKEKEKGKLFAKLDKEESPTQISKILDEINAVDELYSMKNSKVPPKDWDPFNPWMNKTK